MPTEIRAPRISSNDMAPSQQIAGVEVETGRGEEPKAKDHKNDIAHGRNLKFERQDEACLAKIGLISSKRFRRRGTQQSGRPRKLARTNPSGRRRSRRGRLLPAGQ